MRGEDNFVKEFAGDRVEEFRKIKLSTFDRKASIADQVMAEDHLIWYLNVIYPDCEPVQKMDGVYYLWRIRDGIKDLDSWGFDIGIEYWGKDSAGSGLYIRLMNRYGEWQEFHKDCLSASWG